MNNLKKWRWWVALPVIIILGIPFIPTVLTVVFKLIAGYLLDFAEWLNTIICNLTDKLYPDSVSSLVKKLSKWVNQ
tara:strand:- start:884 stop:1111 length:228 start_codon:yes stop_codon:yes gene_type:complete